jgi:predicted lipoprotein with Yx(FWY)xxD motif
MKRIAGTLVVLAVVTAGCGSSSSGGSSAPASSSTPSSTTSTTSSGGVTIATKSVPGLGTVLVNAQGDTLYMFAPDKQTRVTCLGTCAAIWPPVHIASGAKATAAGQAKASLLGSDPDTLGGPVVTYAGWPLYTYSADSAPGLATGQGLDVNGGYWYTLTPAGKVDKKKAS